ncbi:TetR/AcrR family transcriptional regulator [Streptomyces sp. NPDC005799]|uniref:TetR/AcrR family transcriptional regulator n=1 Tax=Streptomyces sp. NPDC005799 TaxID=3154678 RepID=UPI003407C922
MQGSAEPDTKDDWLHFGPLELSPILAAALDVMYENGYHGATVRDIARRVGLTVPALYYHHESKEGLFAALLEVGTGEVAWRVRSAAEETPDRPDLQFVNVIRAVVLHMAHRTRLAALDQELRYLSPRNRQRYAARRKDVENVLVEIIDTGTREGFFTPHDPHETARALLGMCQSVGRWYSADGPLTPDDVAERYIDIALMTVGIAKRPGPRPARRRRSR